MVAAMRARSQKRLGLDDSAGTHHSAEVTSASEVHSPRRWAGFRDRLIMTMVLVASFILIVALGHFYCGCLVMVLAIVCYDEVIRLKRKAHMEERLPLFFIQRWYWFLLTVFGTLYEYLSALMEIFITPPNALTMLFKYHSLIGYLAMILGIIVFLYTLRRYSIRYQFSQLSILLLSCILVVGQSTAQIRTISFGMIWFFLNTSSVIINDIFAYLCGVKFGRTKLIPRISPNKTVEGFLGASIVTFLWAIILGDVLSRSKVMACPETRIVLTPILFRREAFDCEFPREFLWAQMSAPATLAPFVGETIWYKPVWFHSFVLGAFASFVSPFGGLMASAFKRALKVKDFGTKLPGHGGFMDRFDCQLVMGMCTFLYLRTFVIARRAMPILTKVLHMKQHDRVGLFSILNRQLRLALPHADYAAIQDSFCNSSSTP